MNTKRVGIGAMSAIVVVVGIAALGDDCGKTQVGPDTVAEVGVAGGPSTRVAGTLVNQPPVSAGTLDGATDARGELSARNGSSAQSSSSGAFESVQTGASSGVGGDVMLASGRGIRGVPNATTRADEALAVAAAAVAANAAALGPNGAANPIGYGGNQAVVAIPQCAGVTPAVVLKANIIGDFQPQSLEVQAGSAVRFEPQGMTGMRALNGEFQTSTGDVVCLIFNRPGTYTFDAGTNEQAKGAITVTMQAE